MKNRAQVLLTAVFLLLLGMALISGLTSMWRTETRKYFLSRDSIAVFYLAQAGIERAKAELINDWNWGGIPAGASLGEGTYYINITPVSTNTRNVVASATVRDCLKEITVNIIRTGSAPAYIYQQLNWSWREI